MGKLTKEMEKVLYERFGKDSIVALATSVDNIPYVRNVDTFYMDGCFYVLTYALSNKMIQIQKNNNVSIAGEWFTAQGTTENLGYFCKEENKEIADAMKRIFADWIDNGHNNFEDENTIIVRIRPTHGVITIAEGAFEIDF